VVSVDVLGPLRVAVKGEAVAVGGARVRTLLVRLALEGGHVVSAESLIEAVWPEGGPADTTHALQALVSRLRQMLPGVPVVAAPGGYRLDIAADAVDVLRFGRLVSEGRAALRAGDRVSGARLLRDALGLWRGPALTDASQLRS
jgi:DNA-binding SARP family transcriptional activator